MVQCLCSFKFLLTGTSSQVHAEKKIAVDEINRNLERLDQQLRVVEAEGRKLEDKIRGGTCWVFRRDRFPLKYMCCIL